MSFKNQENEKNAHLHCERVDALTKTSALTPNLAEERLWEENQHWTLQSADLTDVESVVTSEQAGESVVHEQTVTFTDNEGGVLFRMPTSDNVVAMVDNTEDIALGSFLSRPTLIQSATWATSDLVGVLNSFNPWSLFLGDTVIKRKIENYAFLRAKLHIKVVLNGTPFQYGALRYCYEPLSGYSTAKVRTNTVSNIPLLVPYSQMPGFFVYPQANAGGEMELPFFFHKNWLDITRVGEVQGMGRLSAVVYAPLGVATAGGSTSVSLRVYAWMSDVHLMGSTTRLTLQANDEYGNGPISKPASALANMASLLTKMPVIGKFARATEIGASATSKIAALFGFTNVPVIEDVRPLIPMNGPMLASSHIGTPVQKLTLDPKQELSIDPTPHGIGNVDELSLTYLKTKESYFGGTSWSTSDLVGTQLFNTRVNPWLPAQVDVLNASAVSVGKRVYHVPLSYIANMFESWRGDIVIRIKVVCTKFHKGRLKISYDPVGDITTTDPPENSVYTEILDIGETDDVEITIPYHQALAWLDIDPTLQDNWTPGNALAPRNNVDNGVLTVRVLTALTAPASGSINLLFFVKGGKNFEFANPTDHIGTNGSNYTVPSFFALQAEDKTDVVSKKTMFGQPTVVLPERYGLNYGEAVHSLRDLLHRSVVSDTVIPATGATAGKAVIYRKLYRRMPYTPGYNPQGMGPVANQVVAPSGTYPYAFNGMHPLPYVAGMFLGYRGGVNYTVTPSTDAYGFLDDIRVNRISSNFGLVGSDIYLSQSNTLASGANVSTCAHWAGRQQFVRDGLSGLAITSNRTNASVQFMIPDYNRYNFSLVRPANQFNVDDDQIHTGALLQLTVKNPTADDIKQSTISIMSTAAAAPDFTCLFFLCCPTLDYQLAAPTPA